MAYGDLNEGEQAHWNEYTNLRQISDWQGFDEDQEKRKNASRKWLEDRRAELWHDLHDEPIDHEENQANKRQQRYEQLVNQKLNDGAPKHEVRLPCSGNATDTEKVYIEEREVYLAFGSTTDEQKKRKQKNVDWLVNRRKELWHLIEDEPNADNLQSRQKRYDNLCIATHHGQAYEDWDKTHNKWGVPPTPEDASGGEGRAYCVQRCENYLGVNESPPESNRGSPQPCGWQDRVYGSCGVAWCACFAVCMAWDSGVTGSGTAGVSANIDLAKQGAGIYRGYTTDSSRVQAGDHAMISCSTCHTGVVVDPPYTNIEGNTSPGSEGSQYNGGCVAKRNRQGAVIGWGLVRF